MNGRDFVIALVVVLVVGGIVIFVLGGAARAAVRDIARTTGDVPDTLAPTEPTG